MCAAGPSAPAPPVDRRRPWYRPDAAAGRVDARPAGVDFTLRFVDRVARPADDRVAARELARLAGAGAALPAFVAGTDRLLLRAGGRLATALPHVVVPAARSRLRSLVGHLIVDAGGRGLDRRLAAARRDGHRLNLNLLGEAVLGRDEADRRLARTIALVRRPGVDHVSVKASSVVAQLVPWDLGAAGTCSWTGCCRSAGPPASTACS